jgi:hypothetical protein
MSYYGYVEYLCEKGHHTIFDVYDSDGDAVVNCAICGTKLVVRHSVDQTNGSNADEPWSVKAPKKQIGYEDNWHLDHYNHKYATRIPLYAPLEEWEKV